MASGLSVYDPHAHYRALIHAHFLTTGGAIFSLDTAGDYKANRVVRDAIWNASGLYPIRGVDVMGGWLVEPARVQACIDALQRVGYWFCTDCAGSAPCEDWVQALGERWRRMEEERVQREEESARWRAMREAEREEERRRERDYRNERARAAASGDFWNAWREEEPMPSNRTKPRSGARGGPDPAVAAAAKHLDVKLPLKRPDLVRAFRKAALRDHPDTGGSDAAMQATLKARETLLKVST